MVVPPLALVIRAHPRRTDEAHGLPPGAHAAVFANEADVGIEGRLAGGSSGATLLVLRSGPSSSYIFLFRKPPIATVAEQVLATGTGGINIAACRVETPKSTTERPLSRGSAASTARDGDGIRLSDHSGLVVQIEEAVS